jgi:hypothetical protein
VIFNIYMMMKEGTISSALWWSRREGLSKSQDGGQFIAAYWRSTLVGMLLEMDVQERISYGQEVCVACWWVATWRQKG